MKDTNTQKMTFIGMVGNGKIQFLKYFIWSYLQPLSHILSLMPRAPNEAKCYLGHVTKDGRNIIIFYNLNRLQQ